MPDELGLSRMFRWILYAFLIIVTLVFMAGYFLARMLYASSR